MSPIGRVMTLLYRYKLRVIFPVVVSVAAAACWTALRSRQWQSSQGLVLRDEATIIRTNLGRFTDVESRRIAQETLLDLARHPAVVRAALEAVGPPPKKPEMFQNGQPTLELIEKMQGTVSVTAPRGAEFGKTEMLYVNVLAGSPRRAQRLATVLTDVMDRELRKLRKRRAASLVNELQQSVDVAQAGLRRATARLVELEREAGADLPELRLLNQSSGDSGLLRQLLVQVDNELRQLQVKEHRQRQLLDLLRQAQAEPDTILSAPNALLALQPGLRKLKEGLIAAELRAAQMRGELAADHPRVQTAVAAEAEIRRQLQHELRAGADAIAADLEVAAAQRELLESQKRRLLERVDRVAKLRAEYANRHDAVRQAARVLEEAQTNLAAARASWQAAESTELLTRVGEPTVPRFPVGPRRAVILAGSLLGGMLLGLALLWLTIPPAEWLSTPQYAVEQAARSTGRTDARLPAATAGQELVATTDEDAAGALAEAIVIPTSYVGAPTQPIP